jgi:hypothetical protein
MSYKHIKIYLFSRGRTFLLENKAPITCCIVRSFHSLINNFNFQSILTTPLKFNIFYYIIVFLLSLAIGTTIHFLFVHQKQKASLISFF